MIVAANEKLDTEAIQPDEFVIIQEYVVYCPRCKTLETLSFTDGYLISTRKFNQKNNQIFHDCGYHEPCRVFNSIKR